MEYDKSLEKKYPEIAKEWHPIKNGDLKPSDVAACSKKRVWWLLPYDDPKSGRHFDFEWQARIENRINGCRCPYLSGKSAWEGYNDLSSQFPEVAKEWHPIKNGDLKPSDVTAYSNKSVWWLLPYDDPKSGRHFDFEWQARIENRINGCRCPYLSGKSAWEGYNDLSSQFPEVAKEWHPTKNGDLKPSAVTATTGKQVWWLLSHDDPKSGKHFDFEWQASVYDRTTGRYGCPYLSGKAVWEGYNDLASQNPEVAKEWHPTKNGFLKPSDVTVYSNKRVWWLLPYDDPKSGKHFDFEWQTTVCNRSKGKGCPYLSGMAVWEGYNDLASQYPKVAKEWHPTKNGGLKPSDVNASSSKRVWWLLSFEDPRSGKHFDFEWQASVLSRTKMKSGCPHLSGMAVWEGYNDLASQSPEVAKEWHPTKNGMLKPSDVLFTSSNRVWWLLPYDDPKSGRHFDFEWQASVRSRTKQKRGCPYLVGQAVWEGYNDLASQSPEVAKEWHPTKNGMLKPSDVLVTSKNRVWWLLPYDDPKSGRHFDFEWQAAVCSRTRDGTGCPYLSGRAIYEGYNDLATLNPDVAREWHPLKNGALKPSDVAASSSKRVWWLLSYDDPKSGKHYDFEWQATVNNRAKGHSCPYLSGKAVCEGYNDLASKYPEVAKEWHPSKNGGWKPSDVTPYSNKRVWWLCSNCERSWRNSVYQQVISGPLCNNCKRKIRWEL